MRQIKREQIVQELTENGGYYRHRGGSFPLAWNIKVHGFNEHGRLKRSSTMWGSPTTDEPIIIGSWRKPPDPTIHHVMCDERFDDRWIEWLEDNDGRNHDWLFWDACRDWTSFVGENSEWELFPDGEFDAQFTIRGRSGGYLILEKFNGWNMKGQYVLDEMDDPYQWAYLDLWELYKLVDYIDGFVKRIPDHMEYYFAQHRNMLETDEWMPEWEDDRELEKAQVGPVLEVA